jgi:hypothetical protein
MARGTAPRSEGWVGGMARGTAPSTKRGVGGQNRPSKGTSWRVRVINKQGPEGRREGGLVVSHAVSTATQFPYHQFSKKGIDQGGVARSQMCQRSRDRRISE